MIDGTIDAYAHRGLIATQHWLAQQLDTGVRPEDATLFDEDPDVNRWDDFITREARIARDAMVAEFQSRPREPLPNYALEAAPSDAEILDRRVMTCACGHFTTFLGEHCSGYTYSPRTYHSIWRCETEQ